MNLITNAALSDIVPGKKGWMEEENAGGERQSGKTRVGETEANRGGKKKPHREKKTKVMEEVKGMKGRCKGKNPDKESANGLETERLSVVETKGREGTRGTYFINYFHYLRKHYKKK